MWRPATSGRDRKRRSKASAHDVHKYSGGVSNEARVETVLAWLQQPAERART